MEKSGKCAKCGDMKEQFVNIPAPGDDYVSVMFEETSKSICKVEIIYTVCPCPFKYAPEVIPGSVLTLLCISDESELAREEADFQRDMKCLPERRRRAYLRFLGRDDAMIFNILTNNFQS